MFIFNRRKVFAVLRLGVVIDNTLSFDAHVNYVCKAVSTNAKALRHIRKSALIKAFLCFY